MLVAIAVQDIGNSSSAQENCTADRFSNVKLTRDEILLITGLLAALLLGATVKYCRARARLSAPPPALTTPAARRPAKT